MREKNYSCFCKRTVKNFWSSVASGEKYYYINWSGIVNTETETDSSGDEQTFKNANYCTNKELMQQQAYRETLNRLLWRYSMEHKGNEIDWNDTDQAKYLIFYNKYSIVDVYIKYLLIKSLFDSFQRHNHLKQLLLFLILFYFKTFSISTHINY